MSLELSLFDGGGGPVGMSAGWFVRVIESGNRKEYRERLILDTLTSPLTPEQIQKVEELTGALRPDQIMWLSGYLAGLAGGGGVAPDAGHAPDGPSLTILYGSQTGNGEKLAEQLHAKALERGYRATLKSMAEYKKNELKKEENLLLILSTHGEGDPPDAALELHEFIHSKRAPQLKGVNYSVLALGDTSYEFFCKTGKDFDEQLKKLGATPLYERKDCDVDYEEDAANWMDGALEAFAAVLEMAPAGAASTPMPPAAPPPKPKWTKSHPFMAPVLERINLNGRGSEKQTLHMELSLEGSGLTYQPGDSLGILPNNRPDLVFALIELLGEDPETSVQTPDGEQTLREALTRHYEITVLTRPVIQRYAALCEARELQALLAEGRNKDLMAWSDGRDLIDLLKAYPVSGLTGQALVDILRKLPPRLYSIASSLEAHPEEAHITVSVVRYTQHGRDRFGVCSNYLGDLDEDAEIPVYIHENRNFKLPSDPQAPLIMIGPGTGVAPFRAFIEEREAHGAGGPNWLFFGDQHFTTDFLYQTDLQRFHKDGVLTRLDVAFSRDQEHKVYVQHRMKERAQELFRWIDEGAFVYVCGDANRMAPDVHAALIEIIAEQGGKSPEDAGEVVKQMIKDKRYQRDTY